MAPFFMLHRVRAYSYIDRAGQPAIVTHLACLLELFKMVPPSGFYRCRGKKKISIYLSNPRASYTYRFFFLLLLFSSSSFSFFFFLLPDPPNRCEKRKRKRRLKIPETSFVRSFFFEYFRSLPSFFILFYFFIRKGLRYSTDWPTLVGWTEKKEKEKERKRESTGDEEGFVM